jgi:hypothetical protein
MDSLCRHAVARTVIGEERDQESGLLHLAHECANLMLLLSQKHLLNVEAPDIKEFAQKTKEFLNKGNNDDTSKQKG